MFKKRILFIVSMLLVLSLLFTACGAGGNLPADNTAGIIGITTETEGNSGVLENAAPTVDIATYTIVIPADASDYERNAAKHIQREIIRKTATTLPIVEDTVAVSEKEILIGRTNRELSEATMEIEISGMEFVVNSDNSAIALHGEQFMIAAAANYFINTYFEGKIFTGILPELPEVHAPTPEKANNYFILIGDGMGENHTKLFDVCDSSAVDGSDREDVFYGYLLPNQGSIQTDSLDGTTDSAASATAIATGFTTHNGYIGVDKDGNPLKSLTELANELGFNTAVMSTEVSTGATPAGFSAHVLARTDEAGILEDQEQLKETVINCGLEDIKNIRADDIVRQQLDDLDNDNGIFLMYEEAYIDKHSHSNDIDKTFEALVRFNQVIGAFMEFAMYNPDTAVIITADHETGGLEVDENGEFSYTGVNHTSADVKIFAYGVGTEIFDGCVMQNIEIPKFVSSCWGVEDFGDLAG